MTGKLVRFVVSLFIALTSVPVQAVDGAVSSLAEAKAQLQLNPDKHILVFYKNYRS